MRQYRIVRDSWRGYEVQTRWLWWPFWTQVSRSGSPWGANTHDSIQAAEEFINWLARPVPYEIKRFGSLFRRFN